MPRIRSGALLAALRRKAADRAKTWQFKANWGVHYTLRVAALARAPARSAKPTGPNSTAAHGQPLPGKHTEGQQPQEPGLWPHAGHGGSRCGPGGCERLALPVGGARDRAPWWCLAIVGRPPAVHNPLLHSLASASAGGPAPFIAACGWRASQHLVVPQQVCCCLLPTCTAPFSRCRWRLAAQPRPPPPCPCPCTNTSTPRACPPASQSVAMLHALSVPASQCGPWRRQKRRSASPRWRGRAACRWAPATSACRWPSKTTSSV